MPNRFERTGAAGVVGTAGSTQRKARELTRIVADARGVGVDVLRPIAEAWPVSMALSLFSVSRR